jgi:hypothetical protein
MSVPRLGNNTNLIVCILHPSSKGSSSHHNPLSIPIDDTIAFHTQETGGHVVDSVSNGNCYSYNDVYKGQQEVLPMAISTSPQQAIYPKVQQRKTRGMG